MKKYLFLIMTLLTTFQVNGQYRDFYKVADDWEDQPVPLAPPSTPLGHYLYDSLDFDFRWKQEQFMTLFVKRKMFIRVDDHQLEEGIFNVTLPSSFDPFTDADSLAEIQPGINGKLYNTRVDYFQVRKVEPSGQNHRLLRGIKLENDSLRNFKVEEPVFIYHFKVKDVQPGDFIQIEYQYQVPYLENWFQFNSYRVFFEGADPKEIFHLKLSHEEIRQTKLTGSEPDSTYKTGSKIHNEWSRRNLRGGLFEANIRPHDDLDYIGIQFNSRGEIYRTTYTQGPGFRYRPYWVHVLQRRFHKLPFLSRISRKRFLVDRQNRIVNDFIEESSANIGRDIPAAKAIAVHQQVNDDFEYQPDNAYFQERDRSLENIGNHVDEEVIREISRFNFYAKYLMRLKAPFRVVLTGDSRFDRYSEDHLPRAVNTDFMFEVFHEDQSFLLYPKRSRGGLEASEYPFYLEGSMCMHIDIFDIWSDFECDYGFDTLYYYGKKENYRLTNTEVSIDEELKKLNFKSNVRLSGQFSTVMRNNIRYDVKDPWIESAYYQRLWEIDEYVTLNDSELVKFQRHYPYKSSFNFNYSKDAEEHVISPIAGKDDYWELPFKNWTNIVIPGAVKNVERRMHPFYPDFLFRDYFNILIKIPASMSWNNREDFIYDIKNEFGKFKTEISRNDKGDSLLTLIFEVNKPLVYPEDFWQVRSLYHAVENLNHQILILEKTDTPID